METHNLKRQNQGMEASFIAKGIHFEKIDDTEDVDRLTEYNLYLKSVSAANRPKENKPKDTNKPKEKNDKEEKKVLEEEEDLPIKDVKPSFSTIVNMEDIKRAFFCKDYDTFHSLVRQHPFKYYKANYKYSSDNAGRPEYVAKNLLRGFVQSMDDSRKYLMVCFRCILVDKDAKDYRYPSYWIVNSNDDLSTILGSQYEDFDFIQVEEDDAISILLNRMHKNEDETDNALVGEQYLH
jgi:hypothetical protein